MKDLCKQLLVMSESGGQRGVTCFFVLVVTLLDERGFPFGPCKLRRGVGVEGGVVGWGWGVDSHSHPSACIVVMVDIHSLTDRF